jgi:hypothetical protein
MDTYIFLTGRIVPGQPIAWNIPPMPYIEPVPQVSKEDADAAFDAPCTISFFDHLIGCCAEVQTDTNMLVSRYMNRHGFLDMQSNFYLDGWWAATEGQPLAAMPTEYHEAGWWAAGKSKPDNGEGSIEDDHSWIAGGC